MCGFVARRGMTNLVSPSALVSRGDSLGWGGGGEGSVSPPPNGARLNTLDRHSESYENVLRSFGTRCMHTKSVQTQRKSKLRGGVIVP